MPPRELGENLSLAEQAVARSTASVIASRTAETKSLIEAGVTVMTRLGTARRASVAEIVAEAGLSNQAFYRHFATKDALVAAIVDDGSRRLVAILRRRMEGLTPREAIEVWIKRVLAQANRPEPASATRAILWNGTVLAGDEYRQSIQADALTWTMLEDPLSQLGVTAPRREAELIGILIHGVLNDALWSDSPPDPADIEYVTAFCLRRLP